MWLTAPHEFKPKGADTLCSRTPVSCAADQWRWQWRQIWNEVDNIQMSPRICGTGQLCDNGAHCSCHSFSNRNLSLELLLLQHFYLWKWNMILVVKFLLVWNQLKLFFMLVLPYNESFIYLFILFIFILFHLQKSKYSFMESTMSHCHISPVAQNRQTKHWHQRKPFALWFFIWIYSLLNGHHKWWWEEWCSVCKNLQPHS